MCDVVLVSCISHLSWRQCAVTGAGSGTPGSGPCSSCASGTSCRSSEPHHRLSRGPDGRWRDGHTRSRSSSSPWQQPLCQTAHHAFHLHLCSLARADHFQLSFGRAGGTFEDLVVASPPSSNVVLEWGCCWMLRCSWWTCLLPGR